MIRIINTYSKINSLFDDGMFNINKWENYLNEFYPNAAHIFKDEVDEYLKSGYYTFENDFLPIINAVYQNPKLEELNKYFLIVTTDLNEKIYREFGKELDIDLVLYLGLCNGAGWVTKINEVETVLLGIEKIIELNWVSLKTMRSLIYHELGHVYHSQYGNLTQELPDSKYNFVWQLFSEGIAMYFEQRLIGDYAYYHQDVNGWKSWCEENFIKILEDFNLDLPTLTRFTQRYFGDWCTYYGRNDVGYYLGTRFIHFLLNDYSFDELINLKINQVYDLFLGFTKYYCNDNTKNLK